MNERKFSLRCTVGIHAWRAVGYNSILNPIPVEQCARCGIGRQFHPFGGEERFTVEGMDEAIPASTPSASKGGEVVSAKII